MTQSSLTKLAIFGRTSSLAFFYLIVALSVDHYQAFDYVIWLTIVASVSSYFIHSQFATPPRSFLFKAILLSSNTFSCFVVLMTILGCVFAKEYIHFILNHYQNFWTIVAIPLIADLGAFYGEPSHLKQPSEHQQDGTLNYSPITCETLRHR